MNVLSLVPVGLAFMAASNSRVRMQLKPDNMPVAYGICVMHVFQHCASVSSYRSLIRNLSVQVEDKRC